MYLNDDNKVSWRPYAYKYRSMLSHISPAAILWCFYYPPLLYWEVLGGSRVRPPTAPRYHSKTPWVGEVTLLQNDHGVLHVPVQEVHA